MVDGAVTLACSIVCSCCEGTGDIGFGIPDSSFKPNAFGKIGTDSRGQSAAGPMGVWGVDAGGRKFSHGVGILLI